MGSTSDWDVMSDAAATLAQFGVEFEKRVVSAHRTPDLLVEYAKTAKSRGLEVIIAGAGGAAHLPGMVASMTALPVIGVPVKSRAERAGFLAFDRADARRHSGGHHRPSATPVPPTPACSPCRCSPPSSPNWPTSLRITVTN